MFEQFLLARAEISRDLYRQCQRHSFWREGSREVVCLQISYPEFQIAEKPTPYHVFNLFAGKGKPKQTLHRYLNRKNEILEHDYFFHTQKFFKADAACSQLSNLIHPPFLGILQLAPHLESHLVFFGQDPEIKVLVVIFCHYLNPL